MIQFADENTKPAVRSIWKEVFGDKDEYIDLIFDRKYRHDNTLIWLEDNVPVASLQMFPYSMRFYGEIVPFYYLAGLCTLPEYRNKGFMGQLIKKSFEVMMERGIPLSILVPAQDWLYGYYEKFGYTQTFDKGKEPLNIGPIAETYKHNPDKAYKEFDSVFQQGDFFVMKEADDLKTIVEDYFVDGSPSKYNLGGMARILEPAYLLKIYASKNADLTFTLKVEDNYLLPHSGYKIINGKVEIWESDQYDFSLDVRLFARLIFGYHLEKLQENYHPYFSSHQPVINLMLE